MKSILVTIFTLISLISCVEVIKPDFAPISGNSIDKAQPQYIPEKFEHIFANSKLQYPNNTIIEYNDFHESNYKDYFYINQNGNLVMSIDKNENFENNILRNELHEGPTYWRVDDSISHSLIGKVRLYYSEGLSNYTWMQIHAAQPFSYPLLRIVVMHIQNGIKDHMWAIVRSGNKIDSEILWIDLGERPKEFFNFKVEVKNSKMLIYINNKNILDMNVDYWKEYDNYFKAGIYSTKEDELGNGAVIFETLDYLYN